MKVVDLETHRPEHKQRDEIHEMKKEGPVLHIESIPPDHLPTISLLKLQSIQIALAQCDRYICNWYVGCTVAYSIMQAIS